MSEIIKTIFDAKTNELEVRPMTDSELAQYEKDKIEALAKAQLETEAAAKKAAAEVKLAALGLDADDLKALGL